LRLWAGDTDGYQAARKAMLERFSETEHTNRWGGQALTMICCLAPAAVPDLQVPTSLAEAIVAAEPDNPWFLLTLGAARYRTGKFQEAIEFFRRALKGRWPEEEESRICGTALIRLFLSLAHHQLGAVDEARQRLHEAVQSIDNAALQDEGKGYRGKEWHIWAACQILRREAEETLKKGKAKDTGK
jgi:tetratricopeptide (TPR) repeat protein